MKRQSSKISQPKEYRFFTIYQQDTIKLPNIFTQQQRQPQDFVSSARKYDIVGYNIVKNYTIKKQKTNKKRERNQSTISYTTNSSRRPTKKIDCITKQNLIQQVINADRGKKDVAMTKFQKVKRSYENIESIWNLEQELIRKRIGTKQTMNSNVSQYRTKQEERCFNTLQERKMNISPDLWKQTLCRETQLNKLYDNQTVQTIIKSPKQLVIVGRDKLKREVEWVKSHPFNMFVKEKTTYDIQ